MTSSPRTIAATSVQWDASPPHILASRTREFLSNVYGEILSRDEADCIAMAAHELLENVIEYSINGTSRIDILIEDQNGTAQVRIQTSNRAKPDCLDTLKRLVERIRATSDPLAVYDELIATAPSRPGSGLGLARIRAEADMQLACTILDCVVTIVAERTVSVNRSLC